MSLGCYGKERSVLSAEGGCDRGGENAPFAGHDAGAEDWATIGSLIETYKLIFVYPPAYLSATLTAIFKGHEQSQIEGLLPWNYARFYQRRDTAGRA